MSRCNLASVLLAVIFVLSCARPHRATTSEKRAYILEMRNQALSELYGKYPQARSEIRNAARVMRFLVTSILKYSTAVFWRR